MDEQILKEIRKLREFTEEKFEHIDSSIKKMGERMDEMNERINKMDKKMNEMNERINKMDKKMNEMNERINKMDERMNEMNERINKMDERMNEMNERINKMDERMNEMNERINTMEKEIIGEYHYFIDTINKVHNEQGEELKNEINKNSNNLKEYKEKVKHGIKLFEKAVGDENKIVRFGKKV